MLLPLTLRLLNLRDGNELKFFACYLVQGRFAQLYVCICQTEYLNGWNGDDLVLRSELRFMQVVPFHHLHIRHAKNIMQRTLLITSTIYK